MNQIIVNVDAGEGPVGSQLDLQLLKQVDALNIALGGHAGDPTWSRELASRARENNKQVHLHPGYPDRAGFGRQKMDISWTELSDSLSEQRAVLTDVSICKFHGAIYNQSIVDQVLAANLVRWCLDEQITELLTPAGSCLAEAAIDAGLKVFREAFADRRYIMFNGRMSLQSRSEVGAVIQSVDDALKQSQMIMTAGEVELVDGSRVSIQCDTICIHSDSAIAIDLAKALRA